MVGVSNDSFKVGLQTKVCVSNEKLKVVLGCQFRISNPG